ncbi:hypothetical protein FOL47_001285 [Perkinsus chesapeaki]|uniref:Uncharacterized protein n=1 Tax=Perkinsus chesapeaki TaxID=330153 RepID=A0A7J6N226_PERCH|nr:hypothetical protein FOL47_001285 [Perkinsus chesapeaki]
MSSSVCSSSYSTVDSLPTFYTAKDRPRAKEEARGKCPMLGDILAWTLRGLAEAGSTSTEIARAVANGRPMTAPTIRRDGRRTQTKRWSKGADLKVVEHPLLFSASLWALREQKLDRQRRLRRDVEGTLAKEAQLSLWHNRHVRARVPTRSRNPYEEHLKDRRRRVEDISPLEPPDTSYKELKALQAQLAISTASRGPLIGNAQRRRISVNEVKGMRAEVPRRSVPLFTGLSLGAMQRSPLGEEEYDNSSSSSSFSSVPTSLSKSSSIL